MHSVNRSDLLNVICCHSGVCIEGQELYVGTCCHVRGGQGKDDEYTCELNQLHEDANGEKIARVRWFYWPAELRHTKRRLRNLPSFSPKEVVLSNEYGIIDIDTISKPCYVISLPTTAKVPVKTPKGTLYCKWQINKESKEVIPAIPSTSQPVRKQREEHKKKEAGTTLPKSPQPARKQREELKREEAEITLAQPTRKQREERKRKEDEVTSPKKRKISPNVTSKTLKNKRKVTPPTKRQRAQPVHKEVEDTNLLQVARER